MAATIKNVDNVDYVKYTSHPPGGQRSHLLSHDSRVDPDKIMLMGFSRGGQATLYAAMTRLNRLWNTSGVRFRAYLPFYPDCMTRYRDDTDVDSAGWRRRRAGRLAHRHSNQVRGGVSRGHPACIRSSSRLLKFSQFDYGLSGKRIWHFGKH
ncbi:hypothetical protein [Burkholderia cenocepacia]|uniref:hypothetical protein n=1 Tax=Burkholderia cenocepacia TaxID=95486 RepID=UPI00196B6B44|nr:hypothetical protein [Burkholderia cenocepacia]MBN3570437.1 hypothetical protein [Burkholderia cenocepacia]MBR8109130.1 hypothetical protein [Burkholderia cenocepacia]